MPNRQQRQQARRVHNAQRALLRALRQRIRRQRQTPVATLLDNNGEQIHRAIAQIVQPQTGQYVQPMQDTPAIAMLLTQQELPTASTIGIRYSI